MDNMIEITPKPISPQLLIDEVKTDGSGCVVAYIGLIRDRSHGKQVASVEYSDTRGKAGERLLEIANQAKQKWQVDNIAICHRTGKLKVGDINLVIAVSAAHRREGFAACQHIIDGFKQAIPTHKKETYQDGGFLVEGE